MTFFEDPRLRQRWNQITHDAEAVTENAAAGIWSFQHNYINPCFGSVAASLEQCTAVCIGDAEERLRRRRERERTGGRAEYSFDFYDDWYGEEGEDGGGASGGGRLFGTWGGEDWDKLLAGTGSQRKFGGSETLDQPRRKRGMSYGTRPSRTTRRKTIENDPTVIPSTQPIGFLSKLPWRVGGTLRYKPSAADLQDHPGRKHGESEPLLGHDGEDDDDSDYGEIRVVRKRSGTTGSGGTSDSYRSRGDLFPSDGEGEEDAVALDDDVTFDMIKKDDRSSGRSRSSKGKRPVGHFSSSRTVSRTTIGSVASSKGSQPSGRRSASLPQTPDVENTPSLQDLEMEEARLRREDEVEISRNREAAEQLATRRGLALDTDPSSEPKLEVAEDEVYHIHLPAQADESMPGKEHSAADDNDEDDSGDASSQEVASKEMSDFVPARLPFF